MPPNQGPPPEDEDSGGSDTGWKVATGVAVLLLIGALAWGFLQKRDADTAAEASAAEIEQLKTEIARDQQEEDEIAEDLNKAKAEHQQVLEKLNVEKNDLKAESKKLKNLNAQYNKAQKEADAKKATLRDELAAQKAKTDLATKCAQVMATGMHVIYNAETPDEVMNDVVKEMQRAADSCGGVVNVD
jgi:septal ring factor EnvC (AmiA/AmiB activator)